MQILDLLGMYFDAVVVFFMKFSIYIQIGHTVVVNKKVKYVLENEQICSLLTVHDLYIIAS